MATEFFMAMEKVPTVTHQEKKVHVVNGKPVFYEDANLKAARSKLQAHMAEHKPEQKYTGPVQLITKWCFPVCNGHHNGEYKTSKPDTDNMIKLLKDVMTTLGFWKDDAQVASEVTEKFWSDIPGIYVKVVSLDE